MCSSSKKIPKIFTWLLLFFLMGGCLQGCDESLEGSGNAADLQVSAEGVSHVVVGSTGSLKVLVSDEETVFVSGDDNIVSQMEVRQENNSLIITPKQLNSLIRPNLPLHYEIRVKSLESLRVAGNMRVEVAGLYANEFVLESSGMLEFLLEGQVQNMRLKQVGVSRLSARGLTVGTLNLSLAGNTVVDIAVTELITGEMSGFSQLIYQGGPVVDVQLNDQAIAKVNDEGF